MLPTSGYKSSKNQEKIRRRVYKRTAIKGRNAVMRAYHAYLDVMDRGHAIAADAYEKWVETSDTLREARFAMEQSV